MRDRGLDVTLLRCTTVLMTNLKVSKESPPASNRTITSEVHVSEMVEFNAKHSLKTGEHYMKALIDKWLSKPNAIDFCTLEMIVDVMNETTFELDKTLCFKMGWTRPDPTDELLMDRDVIPESL